MNFPISYEEIINRMESVNPVRYKDTRNFIDGDLTYLSPYIARGVISTRQVMQSVLERGFEFHKAEKLFQELAWRDYWQQVWIAKGTGINRDLKQPQQDVANFKMPAALVEGSTGIEAIDLALADFFETGYLHNHLRLYIAALACNLGKSHWYTPARWMYYHLLDGDWASNALSWQWVAGSNSSKKYYANQENINRYCYSTQRNTYLDTDYPTLAKAPVPPPLKKLIDPGLSVKLRKQNEIACDVSRTTLVYNYYNLDPTWRANENVNRILLLEPSHFEQYPVSEKVLGFILALSKNISGIRIFVGEFGHLKKLLTPGKIRFKEHPLNKHYEGTSDAREWMFPVQGYYPSFFSYWKQCLKHIPMPEKTGSLFS